MGHADAAGGVQRARDRARAHSARPLRRRDAAAFLEVLRRTARLAPRHDPVAVLLARLTDGARDEELRRPDRIPKPLWAVMEVALAKRATDRFRDAQEMAERLAEVVPPARDVELARLNLMRGRG